MADITFTALNILSFLYWVIASTSPGDHLPMSYHATYDKKQRIALSMFDCLFCIFGTRKCSVCDALIAESSYLILLSSETSPRNQPNWIGPKRFAFST